MTNRTMEPEKTAIERATEFVVLATKKAIPVAARLHAVQEKLLAGILIGYFERMTIREWAEALGLELPPGDAHAPYNDGPDGTRKEE
jgi:hypothetical protein